MINDLAYKVTTDFMRTLAHPTRLRIIEELKRGDKNSDDLSESFKMSKASVSRHLNVLCNAGILTSQVRKTTAYYQISEHEITAVTDQIFKLK